jgi:FHA domain/Double zinc ribbon
MTICGKCGAENSSSAKFCQMCASSLAADAPTANSNSLVGTAVFSNQSSESLICSVCDTANERGWAFCQQCGSKLGQAPLDVPAEPTDTPAIRQKTYAATLKASEILDELKKAQLPTGAACPKCSQPVMEGAAFCHKCGSAISSAKTVAMSSLRAAPKARLLLIVDGEATGDEYEVKNDTLVGRTIGDVIFPHDDYMSGRHARIKKRGDKFVLIDEDSRNGSFIRIKKEVELKSGDYVLLGKQLFRFEV